jgi:hypothetical protein
MTDLITMRAKIADEITRSDMASRITVAINDAIKLWEGERFAFNERRYRINTVAAQEYYELQAPDLLTHAGAAVPTGEMILEIDSITSEQSNWPYPLTPRTQQWFDAHQSSPLQYTGQPDSYGIYGNQLRLYPVPDIAYPIIISALARLGPNPVAADADTNDWFTEGEMLIREQAKVILFRFPLKDPDGMHLAQSGADNAYAGLKRKMAAKAGVGLMGVWRG